MQRAVMVAVVAAGAIGSAFAGQIDATAFDPSKRVEVSFTSLPLDFGRPGPVVAGGITFTDGGGSFRTYPASGPFPGAPAMQVCAQKGCIMTDAELDFIAVTLPSPVSMVGAYIGIPNAATTASAEFYAGEALLGTVNISAKAFEGVFAGWNAGASVITSVKFIDTQNQGFVLGLTGFTYQVAAPVPEPASWLLGLLGIVGLAAVGRQRAARKG